MTLAPGLRKVALATHLAVAVGWLGAVGAYLVLDVTVATSRDPQLVRAAWMAMGLLVSWAIVPLALFALLTGLVMSLGTQWGLFRHWWVLISFLLTLGATVVLVSEADIITRVAALAADPGTPPGEPLAMPSTLPHSVGGLLALLLIHVLNVLKPRGLTPYGWRKEDERRRAGSQRR